MSFLVWQYKTKWLFICFKMYNFIIKTEKQGTVLKEIFIKNSYIKLGQFFKFVGLISLGSESKFFLENEEVLVNKEVEKRRGRKLYKDDIIEIKGRIYKIFYKI